MNALWTAFEILINLFQGWLFVYFLQKKLVQSPKRTIRELNLASICTIIAVAAFYSLYLWFSIPITDSVVCIITFVYSLYAFDTKWYISFLWNAFIGLIIVSVANVTSSLFIRFSGLTWESLMAPSMLRLSFVILSNVLLFVVFYIVSRIIPHQELMSWFSLLLFILLNIIALLAMEMQYNLSWQKVVPQKPVLITIFCLLFIISGLLILFELLSFKAKEKADLELQIKTSDLKETHLNEMRSLYQNILELRHDMKHQLNTLQAMIEEGRIEESGTYLKSLRMAVMPVSYLTGCVAVGALLSTKVAYMKHLGIEFDYSPYPLNELPISEPSFCSIVGNLIDNAIEAICRLPDQYIEKRIHFSFSRSRDVLYITCSNPTDNKPLQTHGNTFFSSKRKHSSGYGISSIIHIVEQAEGMYSFNKKASVFTAEITLPYMGGIS